MATSNHNQGTADVDFLIHKLHSVYAELDNKYKPNGELKGTYSTPVNFKESLSKPIHRWYAYKEGFSPSFVRSFIDEFKTRESEVVFDPFGGVGTTTLESSLMGHESYSLDINPLGNFVSAVKNFNYPADFEERLHKAFIELHKCCDKLAFDFGSETIRNYFYPDTFESILSLRRKIQSIADRAVSDFLLMILLSKIECISTHRKDGNGVKRKRSLPPHYNYADLVNLIETTAFDFVADIQLYPRKSDHTIIQGSNLIPYSLPKKATIVITSPPYANCFDYSKVYMSELWMGEFFESVSDQKRFRQESVSSHVHYVWAPRNLEFRSEIVDNLIAPILKNRELWSAKIPNMLSGYFADMGRFLSNLIPNLEKDAHVGIVVGNSAYAGIPIATDLIISSQAEKLGYEVETIRVYRKVIPSSQQFKQMDSSLMKFVRESLIVLRWPK